MIERQVSRGSSRNTGFIGWLRRHGTIFSATLVTVMTSLTGILLSERLGHLLAERSARPGLALDISSPAILVAFSEGALAVLLVFMLLAIVSAAIAKDIGGLGRLLAGRGSFSDPSLVNLGHLNKRGREESLFARIFSDVLKDHREIERRLSLIIDNIGEGIITIDDRGNIGSFNPACERFFGWRADEVIGNNVSMLMPDSQGRAHDSYLKRYLETRERHFDWAGRTEVARRADGTEFPIELTVSQISINGRIVYVGIVRDITERLAAEKAKAEFLATVSHELRTPLTSIRGALKMLSSGALTDDATKVQRITEIAEQNSERLGRLIDSILDMEKLEAGKLKLCKEPLDLCKLVKEALETFHGYAQQYEVTFEISDNCQSVIVFGDHERLMQVMANLLSNAAKFSRLGGVVYVSGKYDPEAKRIRVEVQDNGRGIPEEAQASIFEKFTQADNSDSRAHHGTGLGLAIARKIIEMHGGLIDFRSKVDVGTTFFFELPVEAGAADEVFDK